ncbi:MAG: 3-deoxy-8-phosphooctulonate synthase [Coxiellaceae bacterium]|jgi:2-dehydro-3-deoxyphosphooctonate aldolase (KDO 8-P synthase)|nr:3-deoxy-8-phosphooctulonate synthase [Coxiellaceae bacterium]
MKICNFEIGNDKPFFLIAGPCVIESEKIALESAFLLKEITTSLKINFIYKTSFEKANRTSANSYMGPGFYESLRILNKIRNEIKVPILTDVHEYTPYDEIATIVDVLQTPAFLCRQTNFIKRVMEQNKPVNIKKGQFLSPWEMKFVVEKAQTTGNNQIMVCERGITFGYNNLVVDMRSLEIMKETNCPVIFDAGHSVQYPGIGYASGGKRDFIPILAKAAIAVGIAGLFIETHPNPDQALCDGPNMLSITDIKSLLTVLQEIDLVVKKHK